MTQGDDKAIAVLNAERTTTVNRLRAAGCVFAEDETDILLACAGDRTGDLETLCRRRVAGEPLEHIVGWVDFGTLRLTVGPGVFVPRQRSRFIARLTINAVRSSTSAFFVEAFSGVAPIAVSVQRSAPSTQVHSADVDHHAVRFARENLGPAGFAHHGPGLTALPAHLRGRVGVIAAVPPYAPTTAAHLLSREARDFEPPTALFGGTDGLDHVRQLCADAPEWLTPGGHLLIEMNKRQYAAAARYAEAANYRVTRRLGDDGQTAVLILHRRSRSRTQ